ncbi:uncharacterized protein [Gossypium hirsutum]|uniref:Reverse transcriptase zinc-binding domain-containing protein n=1 Tax=Gossypium hirsutum TaxID=3635 RepID=A0ABM3BLF8_GOSHI|nr:uncharacterized protein LOC121228928 [Gossypium hirsutum]
MLSKGLQLLGYGQAYCKVESFLKKGAVAGVVLEKLTDDNHDLPQKVAELMTKENNCWKLNQIRRYISEDQVKAIQSLPAYSRGQDKMVLTGSKDGNYVVKKGCHELKEKVMKEVERRASPSHNVNGKVWKWIWSISLPQKIKHFLWRAVGNLVATNGNLVKRRIKMSELCPVCLKEAETVEHTLLLCDWAQCVWYGGALGFKVDCHRITTLDQWLLQVFDVVLKDVQKFLRGESVILGNVLKETQQGWERPLNGWIEVNCDRAFIDKGDVIGVIKGNFVDFDFKKVGKEANKAADWCAHLAGDVLLVNPHPHW